MGVIVCSGSSWNDCDGVPAYLCLYEARRWYVRHEYPAQVVTTQDEAVSNSILL